VFGQSDRTLLKMNDDIPRHVLFWPWAFVAGFPLVLVGWLVRSRFNQSIIRRIVVSLVVACAVAPAVINHGARPFVVYAFPLLFTADPALGFVAALPPITILAGVILAIWSWQRKKTNDA